MYDNFLLTKFKMDADLLLGSQFDIMRRTNSNKSRLAKLNGSMQIFQVSPFRFPKKSYIGTKLVSRKNFSRETMYYLDTESFLRGNKMSS